MKNIIALGVLVVLGVAALLVFREKPAEDKAKLEAAIKPVSLDKLDTITVKRKDGIGDKKKDETYTLTKKGDEWRLSAPVDYAAVQSSVESMTRALNELKVVDIISEKAANHSKFKIGKEGGVEVIAQSGKETLLHMIIGSTRSGFTFARLPDKNTVYRLKGSFRFHFDKASRMLRDKKMIKAELKDVKQVTFEKGEEKLVLAVEGEDGSEVVKPVDTEIENFDESKAKGVVRSVISLNTIDFQDEPLSDEKTGLGEGAAKVVLEYTKDEKPATLTLTIGNSDEELKKTYAKVSDSDQIFLISDYTAKRLKFQAADYARTDEEMEKAKAPKDKGKSAGPPPGMGGMGGPGGPPGGFQVTPEMLKQMQKK